MKNWILLILSSLLFCSFQYSGDIDYWIALKGIKNVKYKKIPSTRWGICNSPFESTLINIERKIRTGCQFSEAAKKLDSKKIQIRGWISCSLAGRRSIVAKTPFDFENMEKVPSLDEKIELDTALHEWDGQKVSIKGTLRLNKEDGRRHCYLLEDIEQIELEK